MKIWVDAQMSPAIADWVRSQFDFDATAIRDIGLRDEEDIEIFNSARSADAIVITKDRDFILLLDRLGPPPRIIWLRCGNTSNDRLKSILSETLREAMTLLESGEILVEINSLF